MNPFKILKNEKGVALLLVSFCVVIITFLAIEINFDASVEYTLASRELNRVIAHEAAKAGLELSLLRIQLFKNVTIQYGEQLKGQESILQMVWSLPFTWPPMIPTETSIADKDIIQKNVGESLMEGSYIATISSEGSRIDLNDLDSPSEPLRLAIRNQLTQLFDQKIENDEKFAEKYRNFRPEELINNIQDYIDADNVSLNGGDEKALYNERTDVRESELDFPPNRPFQTMEEIKVVAGMDEELFQFLLPQVTVYGIKAINVNQANEEILKSIDPIIDEDMLKKIIERRNDPKKGGPFRDENDFMSFIGANEARFNPSKIPLFFGNEYNFRIRSIGEYKKTTKEIIAIVYDVDAVRDQLIELLEKEDKEKNKENQNNNSNNNQPPASQPPQNNPEEKNANEDSKKEEQKKISNTRPRIIYYFEK